MPDTIGIWCRILQLSIRAIQIEGEDGRLHWLPRSQIGHLPDECHWQRPVLLDLPVWLAEKEGLV